MQFQRFFGADTMIHTLLMRYYNRERLEVFLACNPGTAKNSSQPIKELKKIPNLQVRPTNFGPSINNLSKFEALKITIKDLPSVFDFFRLARYIKKNRINIITMVRKNPETLSMDLSSPG